MAWLDDIAAATRGETRFVRLTFSAPAAKSESRWRRIVIQPIQSKSGRRLQAIFEGERKQEHRTIAPEEIEAALREFLALGFRRVNLQCADGDLHVRITKKGRALVRRARPSVAAPPAPLAHDREKEYPFPAGEPNSFLEKLGVMRNGRVKAAMQDKFRQINQFLMLLAQARLVRNPPDEPLRIVDCGCGRAFLTFAAHHYLREKRGLDVHLTGVDANDEVVASAQRLRDRLGLTDVQLVRSRIAEFSPPHPPHAVLSLHACDTATDEAIAQGARWEAPLMLCVPCCQHELHHQLDKEAWRAALRHGILRERLADILTDALRAAALRVMGYKAEVIEFISPGHTAKNLMIRAERARGLRAREAAREYLSLRGEWDVEPAIERLLGDAFRRRLGDAR